MLDLKQGRLRRLVDTRDFKPSDTISIDLPTSYDLNTVMVEVSGTITVGTGGTYHTHAVSRLIDRLDLFADGKNKFSETTGLMSAIGNFERRLQKNITEITAGTGAKTVLSTHLLDRINADGMRPKDSALHTYPPYMTKLQLVVKTNAFSAMEVTAGTLVVSSHTLKVKIYVFETQEFEVAGQREGRLVKQESLSIETIDSTTTTQRLKLPTGALLTRGVKFYALNNTGVLDDTIINNVTIKSGVDVRMNLSNNALIGANIADYHIPASNRPTGFYFADLCPDGNLNSLYDTRGLSELDVVFDVTKPAGGDGQLVVVTQQFYEQPALDA